jgi:PAS domain S-box-containing protein
MIKRIKAGLKLQIVNWSKFKDKIKSPSLLFILMVISIISIAVSIYYEYRARQKDYLSLLENQANIFINTLSSSTQNAITAAETIEDEINSRVLSSIKIVEKLDQQERLSKSQLEELLEVANVEAIHVYDRRGTLTLSAAKDISSGNTIPFSMIQLRIQTSFRDTILTTYDYENPTEDQIIALVTRKKGGIIAAIIGKDAIQSLKRTLGVGYFLKRFQAEENIEYVVIQNSQTIVAGSFDGYAVSSYSKDPLLRKVQNEKFIHSRILNYNGRSIFETISSFSLYDQPFGVLRLGLSMKEYEGLRKDIQKRLFIFSAVIIVIGLIFISFLMNYRHRKLLHRDLERLQDYTNTVLKNLSNGVISFDQNGVVQTINKRALQFLGLDYQNVIYQQSTVLPAAYQDIINDALFSNKKPYSITKKWLTGQDGRKRLFTLRTNLLKSEDGASTCILLIDDITDQTQLEEQIKRNQRLTSMRNLAMTVAHEIKNPLNAIKLIIDLIHKKYKPLKDGENYSKHLNTVRGEIDRISNIVEQYLQFSRPPVLKLTSVIVPDLIDEISILLTPQFKKKKISVQKDLQPHPEIRGDRELLKQVFINLLKNAEEAIEDSGKIVIIGRAAESNYEIHFRDNGKGIQGKALDSIFDLYFTTKSKGSGVGLSVVQQVISAHHGTIDVESEEGQGTTIILQLPFENTEDYYEKENYAKIQN